MPETIFLTFQMEPDFPIGKAPTADGGTSSARGLGLFTEYWPTPAKIKPLAKDWATVKGRPGEDLRWEVKQGIKQAKALLDLARF